jgi:predicted adenine nucleotide alpha hydrolase (AANH) superfamily ATPase
MALDSLRQARSSCLAHKQEKKNKRCKNCFEESFGSCWHKASKNNNRWLETILLCNKESNRLELGVQKEKHIVSSGIGRN